MTHLLWPMDTQHLLLDDIMKERRQFRERAERRARIQSGEEARPSADRTAARFDLSREQSAHDM